MLSPESSSVPGRWRTEKTPYLKDIMDAASDNKTIRIVVMSASQGGKNEMINNVLGRYIDIDPCPMLMIEPSLELAEDYSKRRLSALFRDTECLRNKIYNSKSRDSNNTILSKNFPGGSLALVGANSPRGLASKPIRIVIGDEIDGFPESAGTEGDPIKLAEKRTLTYKRRKKIIYVSTPTIKGKSRIEKEYLKGTQEKWRKRCPHCGRYQYINKDGMVFEHSKDDKNNYEVWDVRFRCPDCLKEFDEYTWKKQPGKYVAENPKAKDTRSFHWNNFVHFSLKWEEILKEWLEVKKDPEQYKVFKNTMLGDVWEEKIETTDPEILLARREEYKADLPDGVLLLTCGVDTQDDRLEYEVVGWGKGHESWGIEYGFILGKPDSKKTWDMLDDRLEKIYRFSDGRGLKIACTGVDSGGHFTSNVYDYTKRNEHRRIFSLKGMGGPGIPLIHKLSRNNEKKALLVILGVDDGKSRVISAINEKEIGPKYCHFPSNPDKGYDLIYFKSLLSERQVFKNKKFVWEKISEHGRNEAFDARNYAQAARDLCKPNYENLEKRLKELPAGAQIPINSSKPGQKRRRGVVKKGESY